MAVGSRCQPFGGQVADLSPIGAALTTGVFITGRYRLFIRGVTISAHNRDLISADNLLRRDNFSADNFGNPQLFADNLLDRFNADPRPLMRVMVRPS